LFLGGSLKGVHLVPHLGAIFGIHPVDEEDSIEVIYLVLNGPS
jgi:hypothetical protein